MGSLATVLTALSLVACTGDESTSDAVRVPSLIWMTTEQATTTLDELGLDATVDYEPWNECELPQGRVVTSEPPASSAVRPGSSVELRVLGDDGGRNGTMLCRANRPFEETAIPLLDLARFGDGRLEFAPTVRVWVEGRLTRTLSAGEATDPEAWGDPSPLTHMVAATEAVRFSGDQLQSPLVETARDPGGTIACGSDDPPAPLARRPSVVIKVDIPSERPDVFCHWVRVYRDDLGRITDVTSADRPFPE